MQIANLVIEMSANIARLSADMQAARGVVERNAQAMQKAADLAGKALGALGVGLSVAAFTGFVRGAIDAADAAGKLSARTGIATKDLAGLQIAYEQAGLGQDMLANSTAKLSKEMADGGKTLEAMGIKSRGANGELRATKDVIYDVANKFSGYADGASKAALAQELFGKSGSEMIPLLNGGAAAMIAAQEAAEKLGLTISDETAAKAGEFNDTLDLLQRGLGGVSTRVAAELLPTLSNLAGEFLESATQGETLKDMATGLASAMKILYSVCVGVFEVLKTIGTALGGVGAGIAAILRGDFSAANEIGNRLAKDIGESWAASGRTIQSVWQNSGNATVDSMVKTGAAAKAQAPNIDALKKSHEAAAAAAKKAAEEARKLIEDGTKLTASLLASESGLSGDFAEKWEKLNAARSAGKTTLEELTQAQAVLLSQQPAMKAAADAQKKALEEEAQTWNDVRSAMLAYGRAQEQVAQSVLDGNKSLREEIELIGLSSKERTRVLQQRSQVVILTKQATLAELERQAAITGTMTREQIALAEEIKGLQERNELLGAKEARESWTGFWESVDKTSHDTFINVAEEGMGAFKRIGKTLKSAVLDALYQMTAKRWFIAISAAGPGGAALAGGDGGGMGMLSSLGSIASGTGILGAGGLGLQAGFGALINGGLSGIGAAVSGGLSAIGAGTGASIAAGLGTIAGALGPIGLGIAGAMMLMPKGDKRFGSSYRYEAANDSRINGKDFIDGGQRYGVGGQFSSFDRAGGRIIGGPNSGTDFDGKSAAQATVIDSINTLYKRLGSQTSLAAFQSGFESSEKGKGFAYAGGVTNKGEVFGQGANGGGHLNRRGSMTNEQAMEAYALELKQATLQALQSATDIPKSIASMLDGADIEALSTQALDQLSAAIDKQITDVAGLREALSALPMGNLKDLSFDAASGLIAAAGGLEQLQTNLSFYHQNFYSEAERAAASIVMLSDEFAKLGLSVPENAAQYRDLIAAQDSSTAAGQGLISALLGLGPAFASAAASAAAAASAMSSAIQNYGSSADLRNFQVEQIRQGLANGGLNLTNAQIAGASRDDALAAYNHYVSAGDTRSADAIFSMQQQFANITQANGASGGSTGRRAGWDAAGNFYAGDPVSGGSSSGATAADSIKSAWESITDSIWGEVKRIKGLLEGDGAEGFAASQSNFAIALAQARAGDQEAAKSLPELSKNMLGLAAENTGTLIELQRIQAQTAASLSGLAMQKQAAAAAPAQVAAVRRLEDNPAYNRAQALYWKHNNGPAPGSGGVGGPTQAMLNEIEQWIRNQTNYIGQPGMSPGGLPPFASFDVGTNYVPHDMLALVHKGEEITPVAYNPAAGGRRPGGGDDGAVVAELRALRAEVAALRAGNDAVVYNTGKTKDVLVRVTHDGQAMQSEPA